MGVMTEAYVRRAPFPSRCPACTCRSLPCSTSPGHAVNFICALCTWVVCDHCERGGECHICAENISTFYTTFATGRRNRCAGCLNQLAFGDFPTKCPMCARYLCHPCLAAHQGSCGQVITSWHQWPCAECGTLIQAGTQAQRCPQCGDYVCLSCTAKHHDCTKLGGSPPRAPCDQCDLTPAATLLRVCRTCDIALCAQCTSHGYVCLCRAGPSPFPLRSLQEQRFFTHSHLARCWICNHIAGSGHWTLHYCSEHRLITCEQCIRAGLTAYGPCHCFKPRSIEDYIASARGLLKCMYCDFEDSSLTPCPFCGQVVCQMHPLHLGPRRCECWTLDARYLRWEAQTMSHRQAYLQDHSRWRASFLSIGGFHWEDYYEQKQFPKIMNQMPDLLVPSAMKLAASCETVLGAAGGASADHSGSRLCDIAWRIRADNFTPVCCILPRTNDLLPLEKVLAPGESGGKWTKDWQRRYMDAAPFATHFASHRVQWAHLHDRMACHIGDPRYHLRHSMVASGTTVRPAIGSQCDEMVWNNSDCHVCDLHEGIRHPRILEHL